MFEKYLDKKLIEESLTELHIVHNISDRVYWEKVKKICYDQIKEMKSECDHYIYEPLYASLYREFVTRKNRENFEKKYFQRRVALQVYTFMEAFENRGEYIEKIIDLIWMILEETDWALPAHLGFLMNTSESLPYYKDSCLDLFAAETGSTLSIVYTIMKEKLDAVSINIARRIEEEIDERIIQNYLDRTDYYWMGLSPECATPNNWNPWINSNIVAIAVTMPGNKTTKTDVLYKVMQTLDRYLDPFPDDGACDEGPGYWFKAGAAAIECMDLLCRSTAGKINVLDNEKTCNIAEYIANAYIYNSRVVNFADSSSVLNLNQGLVFRIGKLVNSPRLMSLAKQCFDIQQQKVLKAVNSFRQDFYYMEHYDELKNYNGEYFGKKTVFLKSIAFLAVREDDKGTKGLFLAAKGGNNDESHNHNDIGNFMVYKDGEPFLIDTGNMTYTAYTFDYKMRYTIWTNISEYHNLPQINGKNQHEGKQYCAEAVSCETDMEKTVFSLDIKNAYENRQDINKWIRTIVFDRRNSQIRIKEDFSLKKADSIVLNFMGYKPFLVRDEGLVMTSESGTVLKLLTGISKFEVEVEKIVISDEQLQVSWGDRLYRVKLKLKDVKKDGIIEYAIE